MSEMIIDVALTVTILGLFYLVLFVAVGLFLSGFNGKVGKDD